MKYDCEFDNNSYEECSEEELALLARVDRACKQNQLKWKYIHGSGFLFIYSRINTWRFQLVSDIYVLFHQNTSGCRNGSYEACFHRQQYRFNSPEASIRYIAKHDNKKYQRDQYRYDNSSIVKAYQQIERQKRLQHGGCY